MDFVTVNDPFYLAAVDDPRYVQDPNPNELPPVRLWLNNADFGTAFTAYRDEEDAYNIVKTAMREQRAIYYCRQGIYALDSIITKLYNEYKAPNENPKSEECKAYLNQFVGTFQSQYKKIVSVVKDFCKFIITSSNNPLIDVKVRFFVSLFVSLFL